MFSSLRDVLYVRVATDRLLIKNVSSQQQAELTAAPPFSHPRTLLGDFSVADALLRRAIEQVASRGLLRLGTWMLIHPLEKIEGGLTQIEERAFQELARGAGAAKIKLWTGTPLTDAQVLQELEK